MGQPIPPGDNVPLIEGLDPTWNDIVNYIPEDKRAEFAPVFKERVGAFDNYKQWDDLQKSGITAQQAEQALHVSQYINENPKEVYETLAKHLNITPQQAQQVVEDEIEAEEDDDPRFAKLSQMEQQLQIMSQIMLGQNETSQREAQIASETAKLDNEIASIEKKYGQNVPEEQILMRMAHKDMSVEDAYKDYVGWVSEVRKTRPAPMVMGQGGLVPARQVDPTKMGNADVKNMVAAMLQNANHERKS